MSVGNINGTARGTGARFNDNKPDLSLIPLTIIAGSTMPGAFGDPEIDSLHFSLSALGLFQTTGDGEHIMDALTAINNRWRDAARVFEYGKKKYAAWNWVRGMDWSVPLACAARHALAILEGEETDPESGLPHIGHYMANLVMLAHFVRWYPEGNDLPPPEFFRDDVASDAEVAAYHDLLPGPPSRYSDQGTEEVLSQSTSLTECPFGLPGCECCKPGPTVRALFPPFAPDSKL